MIKANELMIGNLLRDKVSGAILRVDELTVEGKIITYVIDRKLFPLPNGWQAEPIPLTEEVLLKCGFEKSNHNNKSIIGYDLNEIYRVYSEKSNYEFWILDRDYEEVAYCKLSKVEYIHQLQNLYFALTGHPLTIKI